MQALVVGGRRDNLLIAPGRGKRLMLRTDPRNRVVTTRAKAKVNHPGVGDSSELLTSQATSVFPLPPAWTF